MLNIIFTLIASALIGNASAFPTFLPHFNFEPPISSNSSNITSARNSSESNYHCDERLTERIDSRYCFSAIRRLPPNLAMGNFHSGSPFDEFNLPKVRGFGNCEIEIDLLGHEDESATWLGIRSAVLELLFACKAGARYNYPGWTQTGDRELIAINIRNHRARKGEVSLMDAAR